MAEKKSEKKLERVYNVPLRNEWLKVPRYKRTKKAMKALKEFAQRHMKSDDICIGHFANEEIWKHGIRNPPHHIKVNMARLESGKVLVELEGKPLPEVAEKKEEEKKSKLGETVERLAGKKKEPKKQEEKKVEKKGEEKKTAEEEDKAKKEEKRPEEKEVKKEETKKPEPAKAEKNLIKK